MYWQQFVLLAATAYSLVGGHLFVGNPPPFRAQGDISLLIMPLNGDPNSSPPVLQQPFPCKGYHQDLGGPGGIPTAHWEAGKDVTFSYVILLLNNNLLTVAKTV